MYGTPLTAAAREAQIDFQQECGRYIWLNYSRKLEETSKANPALFKEIEGSLQSYTESEQGFDLNFSAGEKLTILSNDYRQYSSVACALMAILAIEQSFLFEDENLAPLDNQAITYL